VWTILCLLGLTGVGVDAILGVEEDQLSAVLVEPDAVGVLGEGHLSVGGVDGQLAGILVTVYLGVLGEGHLPVGGGEGQLAGVLITVNLGLGTVDRAGSIVDVVGAWSIVE
jgi:hypothetical protein